MGCDGYLKKLGEPKEIHFTCYECNKPIDVDDPINGHEKCVDERNGEIILRVNFDIEDYESR